MVSNLSGAVHSGMGYEQCIEESKQSLQPCLLITDRRLQEREICGILTNMFNNKPQLLYDVGGEIPEFLGRRIGCSFGEWVLLTITCFANGDKLPELLVNLLSKEIIELPSLDTALDFCALTSHPYDPSCHVVYFDEEENALIFCQPWDKEFTIKKWDYEFLPTEAHAVVAGKLFLDINKSTVGVIEFKESTFRFEVVEMDMEMRAASFSNCFYCEYSGELFVVFKIGGGTYLEYEIGYEIFKADFLNKKLVSVKSLGTLAIFLDYGTAHVVECASVESGIKANSIYLLDDDDLDNYYIYNLEDGAIRMKPIFSSMEMETTEGMQLDWIMLPCQGSICHDSEKEKEASVEVEEVGVQNSWNTVPPELLNLIQFQGKFGRDHAVFGAVCKSWQQASIRDYSISPLLSSTTLLEVCQSSSPLLMFQEDMTISDDSVPIFRFFDPVRRKLYRTGIPELRGTDIHYSKDGWLLVCKRGDGSMFFFNPLTQEKIELPRIPTKNSRIIVPRPYTLSFSSVPTCSDCLVVWIVDFVMFYTLKHGEQRWKEQPMSEFQKRGFMRCPVVLNGLHHFMRSNRDMVVFNLKDEDEGRLSYCQTWPTKLGHELSVLEYFLKDYFFEDYFLEIDGALAFVSVESDGGEISIFKWNDLETGWKLMKGGVDFGGKQMFLSRRGSFFEKIDDDVGGLGNAIFLPMIDDAKEGVFYSPATRRYHTLYSGYSSELPYNADTFLNGIWVKPDRKIVSDSNLKWFM